MKARVLLAGIAIVLGSFSSPLMADERGDQERDLALDAIERHEPNGEADQADYNEALDDIDNRERERCDGDPC